MSEERAGIFIDKMRIVLEALKGEIGDDVCQKLKNGEIVIDKSSAEIKNMDNFLQEKIIPPEFSEQKNENIIKFEFNF